MPYTAYIRTNRNDSIGCDMLDNQRRSVTEWIAARDDVLICVYVDTVSGVGSNRPGLQQMLDGASQGEFDAVVVYKPDRLSRSVAELAAIRSWLCENHGIQLFSVTELESINPQYQQPPKRSYASP